MERLALCERRWSAAPPPAERSRSPSRQHAPRTIPATGPPSERGDEMRLWSYLSVALCLAGAPAGASASTCPHAEFIHPCTCRPMNPGVHVVCVQVNSTSRLRTVFAVLRDYDIGWFSLKDCRLEQAGNLLQGMRIKLLRLMDSRAVSDNRTAAALPSLAGLRDQLTRLDFINWGVRASGLQRMGLSSLARLEMLQVQRDKMAELPAGLFPRPSVLSYLKLEQCQLARIQPGALAHLSALKSLTLNRNRLTSVLRDHLPSDCSQLAHLDLSENQLSSLSEDFFSQMDNLRTVNMFGNHLRRLDENPWAAVWNRLDRLWISDNPIECDSSVWWILEVTSGPSSLYGACAAPDRIKGTALMELSREKLQEQ